MSTHKQIDKICCVIILITLLLTAVFVKGESFGIAPVMAQAGYASGLFDDSEVHRIDIIMDDWEGFLQTCENEEYSVCSVVIDNEAYKNVGIRAKGNTSLSQVAAYGNDRYSFKIEFDHYEKGKSYHGLDKISLNNLIQDNTYMKDYLTYRMMRDFGVAAPLCSYVYITVNGEDWGLYLAVESVEESFLTRNYGSDYGNLYKPDSMEMGGGRGNGGEFGEEGLWDFPGDEPMGSPEGGFRGNSEENPAGGPGGGFRGNLEENPAGGPGGGFQGRPGDGQEGWPENDPMDGQPDDPGKMPQKGMQEEPEKMLTGNGDVLLTYLGDEYENYKNIFDNAKTDISDTDKDRLIASLKKLGQGEEIENVVDTEAVIRYFVVHNFVCNFDSYTGTMIHNYYLYEKDGKLSMIPWDYNLAFGGFEAQSSARDMINYPIDSPVSQGSVSDRPMLAWIFDMEEYTELYHLYFEEFIDSYFDSGSFEEMISSVQEMITPFVEKDPTKFCTFEQFEKGSETLKKFCLLRAESVSGQLAGKIPSTSEDQKNNSAALISADGISLSDMGAMDTEKVPGMIFLDRNREN